MLWTNPEIADTREAEISYEDVVDTIGDGIMEEMEFENGQICDDSYYSSGA